MYLKSLTLKGFKSFADRTSMSFDPGLNVVVGPNGSGKSNVSDAILWVLGEQSAKMLRGQAMEDVIFSGSSARPAVGVAEVTLVLDNSDHTLPIDFSEVGITRRMYRSGESEYLINGAPARLMDVQDILHDSGLGKDTHSIISQGKLDSILQSRPEERRELIEEAADISKHRRRKERSLRKLSSMDDNLARAKVVEREINRQLKPLERQVDKAKRAHDITERLTELRTQLAVDDLRRLQASYGTLSARGREADAAVELAQYRLDEKSAELEKYQSLLEQKGLFVGDLGEQRRRMQDILGRMDSDMRLLEEKGKNMVSRLSEMRMQLSTMRKQRADVTEEHERVAGDLSDARVRQRELEEGMEALSKASREAVAHRRELEDALNKRQSDERQARAEADKETLAFAKLEDQISNAEVEDGMYKSRLEQVAETLATTEEALAERGERKARVEAQLADARAKAEELAGTIAEAQAALKRARDEERSARTKLSSSEATLSALRSVDANVEKASPLVEAVSRGRLPASSSVAWQTLSTPTRQPSRWSSACLATTLPPSSWQALPMPVRSRPRRSRRGAPRAGLPWSSARPLPLRWRRRALPARRSSRTCASLTPRARSSRRFSATLGSWAAPRRPSARTRPCRRSPTSRRTASPSHLTAAAWLAPRHRPRRAPSSASAAYAPSRRAWGSCAPRLGLRRRP